MHMGNMTKDFVPVGKEEQAEIKNEDNSVKVATLLGNWYSLWKDVFFVKKFNISILFQYLFAFLPGIDAEWMINYFCKPKLKVGTELVNKGPTCTIYSIIMSRSSPSLPSSSSSPSWPSPSGRNGVGEQRLHLPERFELRRWHRSCHLRAHIQVKMKNDQIRQHFRLTIW